MLTKPPREYMTVWNKGHDRVTEETAVIFVGKDQTGVQHRCPAKPPHKDPRSIGELLVMFQATHVSLPVVWCEHCNTLFVGEDPPSAEEEKKPVQD